MSISNHLVRRVVLAALAASGGARADVLVDNTDQPTRAITTLGLLAPDNIWAAQSFSGPTTVRLVSIDVLVGEAADPPDVVAELHSGDDPSGALLATFVVPSFVSSGLDIATLVPDTEVVLEPGTVYWLTLGTASTGAFGWAYAEGNATSGPGSLLGFAYSDDQGANWGPAGFENPHQMRVNVSEVLCGAADLAKPFGVLDFSDVIAFLVAFGDMDSAADLAVPLGQWDFSDVLEFLVLFASGCP